MKRTIFLLLLILIAGCTSLKKVEQTKELMGTFVTITVYGSGESAITSAFEEIERIDNLLSTYKQGSETSLLNKEGFLESPGDDLIYNLERSAYYSKISNGAFDITVKPILDLYSYTFSEMGRAPDEIEINNTLDLIDYSNIIINNNSITLKKGMQITLGGIAKGYAIDKAIGVLKQNGVKHALVNAGGDMMAIGNKGNEDWRIALENPRDKEEYITIIYLDDMAVCTSGDYERYFDDSKKFHHLVDPRTGYSASELISVTIIANKAIDCDGISTSVFVLGREKGLELVESLDGVEGLLITREKEIVKSGGFKY